MNKLIVLFAFFTSVTFGQKIEIDEIGSSGGNDNLADTNCFRSEEDSSDYSIFQNFKFNLKIQFTNSSK